MTDNWSADEMLTELATQLGCEPSEILETVQRLQFATEPKPHRCSGCGHRWTDLPGAELCGDCWRKVQPILHSSPQGEAAKEPK